MTVALFTAVLIAGLTGVAAWRHILREAYAPTVGTRHVPRTRRCVKPRLFLRSGNHVAFTEDTA